MTTIIDQVPVNGTVVRSTLAGIFLLIFLLTWANNVLAVREGKPPLVGRAGLLVWATFAVAAMIATIIGLII